ncbi:hypothetical protein MPSI1_002917 [Malassezia psittaci]|uniref:3-methyl-2-oxobutanoate hydroxymethyltransferase n=1 Tax=Malassezia psittaci TaxID=1821823 RepID=A0AAF0JLK6_9BASI|nr:hypothetical protein MPSI1_002917 [Malassezia psittaci]
MSHREPIVCMTAYDYPTGLAVRGAGADICLVGDSLANVALGSSSTRSLSIEAMIHHAKAVRNAIRAPELMYDDLCPPEPILLVDMPFGSCAVSTEEAVRNVLTVIQKTHAQAVKIEGSQEIVPIVKQLSTQGVSVMAHVGLQPQRFGDVASLRVQATTADAAFALLQDMLALQDAGCFAFLLECVPSKIAQILAKYISVPIIGIGAGPYTHGQVLVSSDIVADLQSPAHVSSSLRLQETKLPPIQTPIEWPSPPKFVRSFCPTSLGSLRIQSLRLYADAVRAGTFPSMSDEVYKIKSEELARFQAMIQSRAPLFQLENAAVPGVKSIAGVSGQELSWVIEDRGKDECWAIVGPSGELGGTIRNTLRAYLLGARRPRLVGTDQLSHPPVHKFLDGSEAKLENSIAHVSFETRRSNSSDFVDYSTRYGSIRDEDRVNLMESLLESLGVFSGVIAQRNMRPDPLAQGNSESDQELGVLKWSSQHAKEQAIQQAWHALDKIKQTAPLLHIDESLLHRPLVALSNGQTRRARILQALVSGAQFVVLDEPFTGLDPPTRAEVSDLLAEVHQKRNPRICLVLREQDEIPSFITHVIRISEKGDITLGRCDEVLSGNSKAYEPGSYQRVVSNHAAGIGVGNDSQPPLVVMRDVSIEYGGTSVLNNVSLTLYPGQRMVLVGDNGSGKTTLLSLILGDNPRSYALDADHLTLFGAARDAPSNAHVLLQRRIGHLSPELYNAFPRRSAEAGGLTVEEAIASGYEGIFTRRPIRPDQRRRIKYLLHLFVDVMASNEPNSAGSLFDGVENLAESSFSALTHGSQAIVLLLRAVVHRPALLVLDEPFQGMSSRQAMRARQFLDNDSTSESFWYNGLSSEEKVAERQWKTDFALVLISHYESEWLLSCGHLLRLKQGQVVEQF